MGGQDKKNLTVMNIRICLMKSFKHWNTHLLVCYEYADQKSHRVTNDQTLMLLEI